jgi:hypothetical protein
MFYVCVDTHIYLLLSHVKKYWDCTLVCEKLASYKRVVELVKFNVASRWQRKEIRDVTAAAVPANDIDLPEGAFRYYNWQTLFTHAFVWSGSGEPWNPFIRVVGTQARVFNPQFPNH